MQSSYVAESVTSLDRFMHVHLSSAIVQSEGGECVVTTVGESQAKVILHLDMNSFFASVEQAHDPSLKGIPMAVAGNPKARKGILVTCSYEARALGIYTTMTVGEAKRLCPGSCNCPARLRKVSNCFVCGFRFVTNLYRPCGTGVN